MLWVQIKVVTEFRGVSPEFSRILLKSSRVPLRSSRVLLNSQTSSSGSSLSEEPTQERHPSCKEYATPPRVQRYIDVASGYVLVLIALLISLSSRLYSTPQRRLGVFILVRDG
jgi:hypothetical protein